jgi:CheY-like chemotaxis protein
VDGPGLPSDDAVRSGTRDTLDGLRVVIVDDDGDARELLGTVLTQRRANVFMAATAADALDLVERERPDVLISDIGMPEEDGYMLIGRVRALPPDRGGLTPAVAVTAYSSRLDYKRAIDAGFDAHLSKPIDIDALVLLLRELHSGCREGPSTAETGR